MRNLTTTLCLTIAVLLGSAGYETNGQSYVTETYSNGDQYVGEIWNGKRNGQGTYNFAKTGNIIYVGEFRNGKRHGQGTETFANGNKYVGEFRDDKRNGQGTYTYASGRIKEGIWKDHQFQYAQKVTPSVVSRKAPRRRTDPDKVVSASSGSGFAVSSNGHVITNHHVIEGCQNVKIHHNGKSIPATVVTYDPQNDLALLKGDFRPSTVLSAHLNCYRMFTSLGIRLDEELARVSKSRRVSSVPSQASATTSLKSKLMRHSNPAIVVVRYWMTKEMWLVLLSPNWISRKS